MTIEFKINIKDGSIEFRQVNLELYEIVKWQGKTCYTVGFYRYNKKEPDWVFESVGTRLNLEDSEEQDKLWEVLLLATQMLQNVRLNNDDN